MLFKTDNPHGGDIYGGGIRHDFSSNVNPLGAPESVIEAVRLASKRIHLYPDPYCRALRAALAEYEKASEDHIICGNGASELIYAYCSALSPRTAVMPAPTFSEYERALMREGCAVFRYVLSRENDFALDAGFLDFVREKRPDAVFLCRPNNPTGRLSDEGLIKEILKLTESLGAALFLDECFLDMTDSGRSFAEYASEYTNLFVLKAFTKNFGMAGLRLGYAITSDIKLLSKMSYETQPWNVSTVAQEAGAAALREGEFLEKTRRLIKTERAWLKKRLEGLRFYVCPSDANFLLFYGKTGLHTSLRRRGIAIRDCSGFFGLGEGWYRISVRTHEENEALICAIREVLKENGHG